MRKTFFIITIVLIIATVAYSIKRFNTDTNTIDDLIQNLEPVKHKLTDHSKISLISNISDYSSVYFQTQFILAPSKIEKHNIDNDTLLIIENKENTLIGFSFVNYDILYTYSDSLYNITLCSKTD